MLVKSGLFRGSCLLAAALLAACGGHDGGESTTTPTVMPVQVADGSQGGGIEEPAEGEFPSFQPGVGAEPVDETDTALSQDFESEGAISYPVAAARSEGRSPMQARELALAPQANVVQLGALSAAEVASAQDESGKPSDEMQQRLVRTGIGRRLSSQVSALTRSEGSNWNWRTLPDGWQVGSLAVNTGDAKGVRLGLQIDALPSEALLRFYAPEATTMVELPASQVLARMQAKQQAGALQGGSTYWAPTSVGSVGVIEVAVPPGVSTSGVRLSVDRVIHMVMSTDEAFDRIAEKRREGGFSGACQRDFVCGGGTPQVADAALFLEFVRYDKFGFETHYSCSGMLVGDSAQSNTPYVLTANHCIGNAAGAFDTNASLFWRSTTCGGSTVDSRYALFAAGLEYLYSETVRNGSDMALLRPFDSNYHVPAAGLTLAGWSAATQRGTQEVVGLHHPGGDHLMRSLGFASPSSASNFLRVRWTEGVTAPGSSGSALLNTSGQVIGTLWGGSSECVGLVGNGLPDEYGRFSSAYSRGLRNWLHTPTRRLTMVARTGHTTGPRELVLRDLRRSPLGRFTYQAARLNDTANGLSPDDAWRTPEVLRPLEYGTAKVMAVQDIDADGRDDVVVRRPGLFGTETLSVLQERDDGGETTTGEWLLHSRMNTSIRVLGLGDFDGNGIADLALYDGSRRLMQFVLMSRNEAGNYVPDVVDYLFGFTNSSGNLITTFAPVAVGDFNGTGRAQVLFRNSRKPTEARFVHWQGDTDPVYPFLLSVGTLRLAGTLVATTDIDGDGQTDFVFNNRGAIRYSLSQGSGSAYTMSTHRTALTALPSGFQLAAVTDVNGDAQAELVLRRGTSGEIRIASNPGVGIWAPQRVSLVPSP
ncbi:MAG: hypothetical protein CVU22_08485 [Betaproteobacteria bacterium HGW-Betaproteobacteria-16]|nr:MAG: hypothetical protein CVU22_08485 [Betaproteobacteria bacterium HGW-Betaproteobacteria-16]